MRIAINVTILVLSLTSCQSQHIEQIEWENGPPPSHDYAYHVACADQNHVYVVGGLNEGAFEKFDVRSGKWTELQQMPTARAFPAGAILDNTLYLCGGLSTSNTATSKVEAYNLNTNAWSSGASLSSARSRCASVALHGKLYVIGGFTQHDGSSGTNLRLLEEYDPATNMWTRKCDMPTARHGHSAVVCNNRILVVGGYTDNGETGLVEEYDPLTDRWTQKESMPTPRGFFGLVHIDNAVYAIAGRVKSEYGPIEKYDVQTNTWVKLAPFPEWRNRFGIALIGNTIYLIGGEDQPRSMIIGTRKDE